MDRVLDAAVQIPGFDAAMIMVESQGGAPTVLTRGMTPQETAKPPTSGVVGTLPGTMTVTYRYGRDRALPDSELISGGVFIPLIGRELAPIGTLSLFWRNSDHEPQTEEIEQADVVIVSWHWGLSPYQIYPNAGAGEVEVMEYQKEMGHFAIDAGADMVIGHHSHQPQPMEVYQGKPILYSLANFVHDLEGFRGRTLMAILVRCLISDGKIQRLSYVPGIIRGHGPPDFARPTQVPEVVQRMSDMSSPCGARFAVGAEAVAFALEPAT